MQFQELQLHAQLLETIRLQGYATPTPIQAQAIPQVLAQRDLLACAQTGTGKTAAFALPILDRLLSTPRRQIEPRVLVLVPTRELASQVAQSFSDYSKGTGLRTTVIFGGVNQSSQVRALRSGVDVVVAAPGRLLDLLNQRHLSLGKVEVVVLDEADRMLDMGFIQPIRRIMQMVPKTRQTLMFSATMPEAIGTLAAQLQNNPVRIVVARVAAPAEGIEQQVYFVETASKMGLLVHVLASPDADRVLVFTRTKHGADRVATKLRSARIGAEVIHGNKSQNARERALASFKTGASRVLVATDVAARGIDVDSISHVVNYDVPREPESYVHRIGRTGRAGAVGIALSFCGSEERVHLRDIERLINKKLPVVAIHPFVDRSRSSGGSAGARTGGGNSGGASNGGRRDSGRSSDGRGGQMTHRYHRAS